MSGPEEPLGRSGRARSAGVTAVLILVTALLTLGPPGTTQASAVGYCNIYAPARIATWGTVQEFDVAFGAGCARSGVTRASWTGEYRAARKGYILSVFSPPSGAAHYTARDWHPYGTIEWVPEGATDANGRPAAQNAPVVVVKLGSVSYIAVKRSGGYHEVTARAYHYSPSASAIVPSGSRPGQVQFRERGDNTWRPVAGVKLGTNGQATIRTWSPGPRYYRVSFGEQPTLWNAVSGQVRAR